MHLALKTILNQVERLKGFVFDSSRLIKEKGKQWIEIHLRPREGSKGLCPHCQQRAPGYDRLQERRFEFVPVLGIKTYFIYARRRVKCAEHGICVEYLPWALGKRPVTKSFAWFLASWAKRMSWQEVAVTFRTSWEACTARWRWPWTEAVNG
jgi:transposase